MGLKDPHVGDTTSGVYAAGSPDVSLLVQRLADAEAALAASLHGRVDAVVLPEGWTYLLRETQQALIRSEAQAKETASVLQAILSNTPDRLIEVDSRGIIRFANTAFLQAAGREAVGESWLALSPPEHHAMMERELTTVLAVGAPASFETASSDGHGGTTWLSTRMSPVTRDGERTGVVVATRDVTAAKLAEAQLIAAERLAAVGTMAAGVAHEINNPLASLVANLDLVLDDGASGLKAEEYRAALRDAREGAERIRQIVSDIRLLSLAQQERRRPLDVRQILDSTIRMAWTVVRHRARVVKQYGETPRVFANESRLGQVFLNLVINAAQAIPEGRPFDHTITVSTATDDAGGVRVTVTDTGTGMPPEIVNRLFTPFFTTKPAGEGTGLGLSICNRIVTSLGGTIAVRSVLGQGATFEVCLPAAPPEVVSKVSMAPSPLPSRPGGRILVVDDDPLFGQAMVRALVRHDVTAVSSGQEALALLDAGARFDVILCDMNMPEMTGAQLFAMLEARFPAHARCTVFMSGGVLSGTTRDFLAGVPNKFIEKPVDRTTLLNAVHEHLR